MSAPLPNAKLFEWRGPEEGGRKAALVHDQSALKRCKSSLVVWGCGNTYGAHGNYIFNYVSQFLACICNIINSDIHNSVPIHSKAYDLQE